MSIPVINSRFFNDHRPTKQFFHKWKELLPAIVWNSSLIPIYEWNGILYIAITELEQIQSVSPHLKAKSVFIQASIEDLQSIWISWHTSETNLQDSVESFNLVVDESSPAVELPQFDLSTPAQKTNAAETPHFDLSSETNAKRIKIDPVSAANTTKESSSNEPPAGFNLSMPVKTKAEKANDPNDLFAALGEGLEISSEKSDSPEIESSEEMGAAENILPEEEKLEIEGLDISLDANPTAPEGINLASLAKNIIQPNPKGKKATPAEQKLDESQFELTPAPVFPPAEKKNSLPLKPAASPAKAPLPKTAPPAPAAASPAAAAIATPATKAASPSQNQVSDLTVAQAPNNNSSPSLVANRTADTVSDIQNPAPKAQSGGTTAFGGAAATGEVAVNTNQTSDSSAPAIAQNTSHWTESYFDKLNVRFDRSMIILVNSNLGLPWKWNMGFQNSTEKINPINLDLPSPFRVTNRTLRPYFGHVPPSEVMESFSSTWAKGRYPTCLVIAPLMIGDRMIGMLAAQGEEKQADKSYLALVEKVAGEISSQIQKNPMSLKSAS